jgi:hypothetical protein
MNIFKIFICIGFFFLFYEKAKAQSLPSQAQITYCQTLYDNCVKKNGTATVECYNIKINCLECPVSNPDCNVDNPNFTPCFDEKPYTEPSDDPRLGAPFDWSAREWLVYVQTNNTASPTNGVLKNYVSPFYEVDQPGSNLNPDLYPLNVFSPVDKPTKLDGHASDGWLLLFRRIGSRQKAEEHPLYVFYNKNRGLMRGYFGW